MEGLIPFLIHAVRRQKLHQHRHSFRCLSDGSRRSYHLLGSESFDGSSHHRRTLSEFVPPANVDVKPHVEEFVRSRSFKTTTNNNNNNYYYNNGNNNSYGLRQIHQQYEYGAPKGMNKVHQN